MTTCPLGIGNRSGYNNQGCRCDDCRKDASRRVKEYRAIPKNRLRNNNCARLRYYEKCKKINEIKLKSGCIDCGFNKSPVALHFDHVRGDKFQDIASLLRNSSWRTLEKEIKKCEVRCANCH